MRKIEHAIKYEFRNSSLLSRALTHPSADANNNQRLEFLGDAVLELAISEYLFDNYDMSEGNMTKVRAKLVKESSLYKIAKEIKLGENMRLGGGETNAGGRNKPSILSDALEAIFGAIYEDAGFEAAKNVILYLFKEKLVNISEEDICTDFKSKLQEICQKDKHSSVCYETYKTEGPPHDPLFYVKAYVNNVEISQGVGKSKKRAEQDAAKKAVLIMTEGE